MVLSVSWFQSHTSQINLQKVLTAFSCNTHTNHQGKIFLSSQHNRGEDIFFCSIIITFPCVFANEYYTSLANMAIHHFFSPLRTLLCSKRFILIDLRKGFIKKDSTLASN